MEKFAELIGKAAEQMGLQVSRVWPQMILLHWLTNLVELVMFPILILLSWRFILRSVSKLHDPDGWECPRGLITGIAAIIVSVLTLIYLASFSSMVGAIIVPEASLIKSLIKQ